jgi:hypothetical protein
MCLFVKEDSEIQVAEEPIAVFKNVDCGFFCWYSPMYDRETKRKYNTKLKACDHLKIRILSKRAAINEGFHAFRTISAPQHSRCTFPKFAVIPKGAEYCYGEYDDVVATEIIVFRTKRQFYKYLKKNELQ